MQSTCGKEAVQVLRVLSSKNRQVALSQILMETGGDQKRLLKAIRLLVDLGLVKRSDSNRTESYVISPPIENDISQVLDKISTL